VKIIFSIKRNILKIHFPFYRILYAARKRETLIIRLENNIFGKIKIFFRKQKSFSRVKKFVEKF